MQASALSRLVDRGSCAVVLAAVLPHLTTLGVGFLKDDFWLATLTHADGSLDVARWFDHLVWPTAYEGGDLWRPIPALSWGLVAWAFGPSAVAFRVHGIVFHAISALIVRSITDRLCGPGRRRAGVLAGVLFALAPGQIEATSWIIQQSLVLALTFSLVSVERTLAWVLDRRRSTLATAVVAGWAAFLCREQAVLLPLVLTIAAAVAPRDHAGSSRLRDATAIGALSAIGLAGYFVLRECIFGRAIGTNYAGWTSLDDYARDLHVFERLPTTVLMVLAPLNRALAGPVVFAAFAVVQAAAALGVIHRFAATRELRVPLLRLTVLGITMAFAAWLPVLRVFFSEPSLLNSRPAYFIWALIPPLVACGASPSDASAGNRPRWLACGALVVVQAAALLTNLHAYVLAGDQVTAVREALLVEAWNAPVGAPIVAFGIPSECVGAPSLDRHVERAMRPPFVTRPVDVVPFVTGTEATWAPDLERVIATRGWSMNPSVRAIRFVRFTPEPLPRAVTVFEDDTTAGAGAAFDPIDPARLAVVRVTDAEPSFAFEVRDPAAHPVIRLQIPGRRFAFDAAPALDPMRSGLAVRARLSGCRALAPGMEFAWPLPPGSLSGQNPIGIAWSVARSADESTAVESRRMLLFDDRAP